MIMENVFILTAGHLMYILKSDIKIKSKTIIDGFIKGICRENEKRTGKSWADTCDRCLKDSQTRDELSRRIDKATMELRTCNNGTQYYSINGKNFGMSFPLDDCDELVFLN